MNRIKSILINALLLGPMLASVVPSTAQAQAITVEAPSPAFIATAQPEYFEGRPVYYYNDSWYYRDHGRWSYYRTEPGYLHERRARWGEAYGGSRAYGGGRGNAGGGRGGGHGYSGGRGYAGARYHYRR